MADTFPYMPLYWRDWLTGESTTYMTAEQEGGFLNLLLRAWGSDPPCTLPDDDEKLALLSKLGDRWQCCGNAVRMLFNATEDGRLRNPKQWSIYTEMVAHRERRQRAGRKGGEAKAARSKKLRKPGNAKAKLKQSSSIDLAKSCPASAIVEEGSDVPNGTSRVQRGGWPAEMAASWERYNGGKMSVRKIGGLFKATIEEHGKAEVVPLWDAYLSSLYETGQGHFASPTNFIEHYGRIKKAGGKAKPPNSNGRQPGSVLATQEYPEGSKPGELRWKS